MSSRGISCPIKGVTQVTFWDNFSQKYIIFYLIFIFYKQWHEKCTLEAHRQYTCIYGYSLSHLVLRPSGATKNTIILYYSSGNCISLCCYLVLFGGTTDTSTSFGRIGAYRYIQKVFHMELDENIMIKRQAWKPHSSLFNNSFRIKINNWEIQTESKYC